MKMVIEVLFFGLLAASTLTGPSVAWAAQATPGLVTQWEYRVLKREQILDLGKKNMTEGLNKVGAEGWELVTVDGAYIFKRPKRLIAMQREDAKDRVSAIESDVELLNDRVAWAERMLRKGFLSANQVEIERQNLRRAQTALDRAKKELESLPAEPGAPIEKKK
jgi:hypothetical protein